MKPSISIIIPALNEEANLESTVADVLKSLSPQLDSYEFLIFNDGSTDRTGAIASRLAITNPNIKVIHNPGNKGLGYSVRKGFELASKDYVMWYPGDNGMQQKSLAEMFRQVGRAELIIPYIANPEFRSWKRQILSKAYVATLNLLFRLNLEYYNGVVIYKTELVRRVSASTNGFSFLAEILVRLIKDGHSYLEVPTYHRLRAHGTSKAFQLRNVWDVFRTLLRLVGVVYLGWGKRTLRPTCD